MLPSALSRVSLSNVQQSTVELCFDSSEVVIQSSLIAIIPVRNIVSFDFPDYS